MELDASGIRRTSGEHWGVGRPRPCAPRFPRPLVHTAQRARTLARHSVRLNDAPRFSALGKSVAHVLPEHWLATMEFVSTSHWCGGMPRRGTPGSIVSHVSAKSPEPVSAIFSASVRRARRSAARASTVSDGSQNGSADTLGRRQPWPLGGPAASRHRPDAACTSVPVALSPAGTSVHTDVGDSGPSATAAPACVAPAVSSASPDMPSTRWPEPSKANSWF